MGLGSNILNKFRLLLLNKSQQIANRYPFKSIYLGKSFVKLCRAASTFKAAFNAFALSIYDGSCGICFLSPRARRSLDDPKHTTLAGVEKLLSLYRVGIVLIGGGRCFSYFLTCGSDVGYIYQRTFVRSMSIGVLEFIDYQ